MTTFTTTKHRRLSPFWMALAALAVLIAVPHAAQAACTSQPDGTPCDDGVACTASSTCQAGVCVSESPGCRDFSDAQNRSFCSLDTGQCVTAAEPCAPFATEADGNQNKCNVNYGVDPATGECLYQPKPPCIPDGCFRSECNPTTGACEITDASDPINADCEGSNDFCRPDNTCESTLCAFEACDAQGDFRNCDDIRVVNCAETNPSSCQVPVPTDPAIGVIFGCQANVGCVYTVAECPPPANPCEVLVRDGSEPGCCTYAR
jgi:hypothetical protein